MLLSFCVYFFVHLRLSDPSLETLALGVVFSIGMFTLDRQCRGETNTAPTCVDSWEICRGHPCADCRASRGQLRASGEAPF